MPTVAGIKRQHEPLRIVGDLLQSEIAEKQARSIRYQITIAKLPLAKDIDAFDVTATPINEGLVRDLATGGFVANQRNGRSAPPIARCTNRAKRRTIGRGSDCRWMTNQ